MKLSNSDLARRIYQAADDGGTIQGPAMVELAPGQPTLHCATSMTAAARALGVYDDFAALYIESDEPIRVVVTFACDACGRPGVGEDQMLCDSCRRGS